MEDPSKSHLDEGKEETGVEIVGKIAPSDAIRAEVNGEIAFEEAVDSIGPFLMEVKGNGDGFGEEEPIDSTGSSQVAPELNGDRTLDSRESGSSVPAKKGPAKKGRGLKKWRRIRRDLTKEGSAGPDSSVVHKRRFSVNEAPKARDDFKLKSDVDVDADVEAVIPSGSPRSVKAVEAASLDPELVHLASRFSIGVDSDNSEERSSKSSTAASVPKPWHEIGFGRERGWPKILGQQRGQRGRGGGVDAGKKFRRGRISLEKENSQSSVESDLRSSNVGFGLQATTRPTNGELNESSVNLNAGHSDEVQSGYCEENGGGEDLLREDYGADNLEEANGESEKFCPNSGIDPFIESIVLLETTQEALETEIQKFGEIEKEAGIDDSDAQFGATEVSSSPAFETNLLELQYKLKAVLANAKAKESKVLELEAIICRTQLPKQEMLIDEMRQELELELETLLKKKIEAEIEFLIITKTSQTWKVSAEDQIALLEDQKSLVWDQAHATLKMKEAENKAIKVKEQADELNVCCTTQLRRQRALKLQNKVCKLSLCFFLQLLLLCIAFSSFPVQLLPQSHDIVPT